MIMWNSWWAANAWAVSCGALPSFPCGCPPQAHVSPAPLRALSSMSSAAAVFVESPMSKAEQLFALSNRIDLTGEETLSHGRCMLPFPVLSTDMSPVKCDSLHCLLGLKEVEMQWYRIFDAVQPTGYAQICRLREKQDNYKSRLK